MHKPAVNPKNLLTLHPRPQVTVSCLKAMRTLQRLGHLPPRADIFRTYAVYPNYVDVRVSAIEQLVDYLAKDGNKVRRRLESLRGATSQ